MPGDETRQKHDESDSESEEEEETITKVDIDPSTLTPLSPEVISKQVRVQYDRPICVRLTCIHRQRSIWVSQTQRVLANAG